MYANTQARLNRVAPQLRPAGVHGDWTEPTAAELLSSFNPNGAVTPDHIRTFHHRGCDVGESRRHWGFAKDAPVDPEIRHGVKAKAADGADACLRPEVYADKMTALLDAQRETQYLSHRRKPLGHAPVPQDPVPVPFGGFGITHTKGDSTQTILAGYRSVDVLHPAGEQLTRNYNWDGPGIDPTQFRFGMPSVNASETTATSMRTGSATQLASKLEADYKSTVARELGKAKSYGFDDPAEWDAQKRGRIIKVGAAGTAASYFQTEQPTVRKLMSGWAQTASESPARKKATSGSAAAAAAAEQQRLATSTDASASRSAAGTVSLSGTLKDDVRAHQLLYPCHFVSLGVESKYFAGGRPLENIRELCHKCEFGMSDADIDTVFALVAKGGSTCSIEEFKNTAREKGYM